MSLINNMLKDLESRQLREAYDQDKLLDGVKIRGAGSGKKRWLLPVIVLVLLLLLSAAVWAWFEFRNVETTEPVAVTAPEVEQAVVTAVIQSPRLSSISSRAAGKDRQLIIGLKGRASGVVLRQSGSESSLTLKQIELPEGFVIDEAVEKDFSGIDLKADAEHLLILLPLKAGESLQLTDAGSAEDQQLVLTRSYKAPVVESLPKPKPVVKAPMKAEPKTRFAAVLEEDPEPLGEGPMPVVKKRSALTVKERAEKAYQQAYESLQTGVVNEAVADLRRSIGLYPLPEAYQALAGILINQGDTAQARQHLKQGLQQLPGNTELTYLNARLLVDAGKPEQAHKILKDALPQARRDADYLALYAAVNRQLGDNRTSAQAYVEALRLRPREAVWWMGLGLALDDDQQRVAALEAYYKALAIGLGDSLDSYVMKRVQEIEGAQ